jgi:tetratricopeptide (TPR) repeat protein
MQRRFKTPIQSLAAAAVLVAALSHGAAKEATEPVTAPPIDPAPCFAAAEAQDNARDDDKIIAICGPVIDAEKTTRADRLKALIARAGAFFRKDLIDRAIGDDDAALLLDRTLADIFNARGELWRKKGDRPRALADFAAAIKLSPDHAAAKNNYKSLALELERIGAQMAVNNRPSFDCASARRAVEKAICANPDLANLDRQISVANAKAVREAGSGNPGAGRALQRQQDDFIARRNAAFGRPDYDLRKAMQERLRRLNGADGH